MEEYVSKQETAKFMLKWFAGFTDVDHILDGIIAFGHIPSIEVVHCKDCKHYRVQGGMYGFCNKLDLQADVDDFCSEGEKMDGGQGD